VWHWAKLVQEKAWLHARAQSAFGNINLSETFKEKFDKTV
jgi:hypothetical protein